MLQTILSSEREELSNMWELLDRTYWKQFDFYPALLNWRQFVVQNIT